MDANGTRISANAAWFLERECLRMGAFFWNANFREWNANFRECGTAGRAGLARNPYPPSSSG
jgi:hypothetical protein